ncbi:MAG: hypothetical protein AABW64_03500 [Nanoarchaeota archaeon]
MQRRENGFDIWSILALVFGLLSAFGIIIDSFALLFSDRFINMLILVFYRAGERWFYLLTVICSIFSFLKHWDHFRSQNSQWNLLIAALGLILAIFAWIAQQYYAVHW